MTSNAYDGGIFTISDAAREAVSDIIGLAKAELLHHLGLLRKAIFTLEFIESDFPETIATDGKKVLFNPKHLIEKFISDQIYLDKALIHLFLHCVLVHPFVNMKDLQRYWWDLAVDVCVENMMIKVGISTKNEQGYDARCTFIKFLTDKRVLLDAESIYTYLVDHHVPDRDALIKTFMRDDHTYWYERHETESQNKNLYVEASMLQWMSERERNAQFWDGVCGDLCLTESSDGGNYPLISILRNVLERRADGLNKEGTDYRSFLRMFSNLKEIIKHNHDEFDYNFYSYGLRLYENMPLIEPLEYRQDYQVKEFVIAIDTSGSTFFSVVESFLRKTYNVLLQASEQTKRLNIHILQCDDSIVDVKTVKSYEEIERCIKNLVIKGGGSTDFRPVFDYVEQYLTVKKGVQFGGVLYFTDGFGFFPEKPTKYPTAFIILGDYYSLVKVPEWAIRYDITEQALKKC